MKKLLTTTLLLIAATGCVSTGGIAKIVTAAGKDPSSVHLRVQSGTVTIEYDRANPQTNGMAHSVSDGGIKVGQ
jgi:hypothetical protein